VPVLQASLSLWSVKHSRVRYSHRGDLQIHAFVMHMTDMQMRWTMALTVVDLTIYVV